MHRPDNLSTSRPSDPRAEYTRNLEVRNQSLAIATREHIRFGNIRVGVFVVCLATALAAFVFDEVSWWWLLVPAVGFVFAGDRLERAIRARTRFERAVAFYTRAIARLDGHWINTGGETGDRFLDDEHLYARDLDLFGRASLFELLSAARTRIGEDTLAAWLRTAAAPGVVRARQDAVRELGPRVDLREDLAVLGETARTGVHADALAAWGERAPRVDSSSTPLWIWVLSLAGFAGLVSLILWVSAAAGQIAFDVKTQLALRSYALTMFGVCGAVLWRFRSPNAAVFREVEEAARDLGLLSGVVGRLEAERFRATRLVEVRAGLDVDAEPPSRRIARLNTLVSLVDSRHSMFVRLFGPLVLWDLHLVYAIERWRRSSGPALRRWLDAVGELEALSSLAGYHYEHPEDVFPDLDAAAPCFDGDGLGHPLISEAVMVRNDVQLGGALRVLVVSGSNMSGKSTLLRTVGVNAAMAQAGGPVRARRLRLSPLEIAASIQNQDSLQAGVSRFYAEITRIGRIMRRTGRTPPVLFLIDELLHGTNSHDRRIGAEAIVRGLVERSAIGLVTTHDLALAGVADALGVQAANVHFQDELEHGRMVFDYRMRPGVVQKSNALALMRSVGLEV